MKTRYPLYQGKTMPPGMRVLFHAITTTLAHLKKSQEKKGYITIKEIINICRNSLALDMKDHVAFQADLRCRIKMGREPLALATECLYIINRMYKTGWSTGKPAPSDTRSHKTGKRVAESTFSAALLPEFIIRDFVTVLFNAIDLIEH